MPDKFDAENHASHPFEGLIRRRAVLQAGAASVVALLTQGCATQAEVTRAGDAAGGKLLGFTSVPISDCCQLLIRCAALIE